jgi:hypothetical protein
VPSNCSNLLKVEKHFSIADFLSFKKGKKQQRHLLDLPNPPSHKKGKKQRHLLDLPNPPSLQKRDKWPPECGGAAQIFAFSPVMFFPLPPFSLGAEKPTKCPWGIQRTGRPEEGNGTIQFGWTETAGGQQNTGDMENFLFWQKGQDVGEAAGDKMG